MKVKEIKPANFYTCQVCHKEFELPNPVKIVEGIYPVCSNRCKFRLIYKLLRKMNFSKKNLIVLCESQNIKIKTGSNNLKNQNLNQKTPILPQKTAFSGKFEPIFEPKRILKNRTKNDFSQEFEPKMTYELTKKVINKINLPTIKEDLLKLVQILVQKKLVQKVELEFLVQKLVHGHPLCNKGWTSFEPEPVFNFEHEPFSKRRVLVNWIK